MPEILGWLEKFDINNIYSVLVLSMVLIILFARCVVLFYASKIESALMNKSDEIKRQVLIYAILFCTFVALNFILAYDDNFSNATTVLFCVTFIILIMSKILKKIGRCKSLIIKFEEDIDLMILVEIFPIITHHCWDSTGVRLISAAILCALVETFITAFFYIKPERSKSNIVIKIEDFKWYVFKRIDGDVLLCGDNEDLNCSNKIKLIKLEEMTEKDIYFEIEFEENDVSDKDSDEKKESHVVNNRLPISNRYKKKSKKHKMNN